MIDPTGADPIGDERLTRGHGRWQPGDQVLWESAAGWRGGEVAGTIGAYVQVIDWRRRDWNWVPVDRVRRNVPRRD